jgi:hypothetical protein
MSNAYQRDSPRSSSPGADKASDTVSATTTYLIFVVLSGLFVSVWFSPNDTVTKSLIVAFFGMMAGFRFWTVALIFLMVQVGLFLVEPGSLGAYADSPGSSILAMGVLALVISCCRYLTLTASPVPYRLSNRESARVAMLHVRRRPRSSFVPYGILPRAESTVGKTELLTTLARIVVSVVAVSVLLVLVPLDPAAPENARLIPPAVRIITLIVVLLLIWVVTNGLLNVLVWRRLSTVEARLFLRSELSKWIHREVSSVSRRRIRFRASRRS